MELKPETLKKLYIIKLFGCFSLLLFSVLLSLYEYHAIEGPISAIFLPLYPIFISLPISLHLVLNNFTATLRKFSSIVLLTSVYLTSVSFLVFFLLIGLSIDDVMGDDWGVIFIPFWLGLLCYFVLCVFLYPGLTNKENQLHRNAFVIFLYFFVILATSIILAVKLDTDSFNCWTFVLFPLWVGLGLHCLSFGFFKLKPETKECFTAEKIFLIYYSFQLLLVNLYLELSDIPLWLAFLPFWISLGAWLILIEAQYYKPVATPEQDPLLQKAVV
mmetsp:Transcript_34288/g.60000  ORF Transcript_34288/g.60000 Transcript_34288/m.60000 type:complete len:273 (-) Transcript_34288:1975-2793(-)